jgi:ribosomal protein S27AE
MTSLKSYVALLFIEGRNKTMEKKKMKCPNCGRRAFDISRLPNEDVEVTLKCPQCGKFVSVPCNETSETENRKNLTRPRKKMMRIAYGFSHSLPRASPLLGQ